LHIGDNIGVHFSHSSGKNKAIAAHELAHLSDGWVEHPYGYKAYVAGQKGALLGLWYSSIQGAKGKDLSNKELALTSLVSLPILIPETKANFRAAKAIYALKGAKGLREALPSLAVSQLSYSSLPFIPYIGNKLSKKIRDKLTEIDNKE
jgi:hypothetical protein